MFSRELLDRHGLLDEGTALGADDLEISWRLRVLDLRLAIAADIFVRHDEGVSFGSLTVDEKARRIRQSDEALLRKLERYHGIGGVPSSRTLWGSEVFQAVLDSARDRYSAESLTR